MTNRKLSPDKCGQDKIGQMVNTVWRYRDMVPELVVSFNCSHGPMVIKAGQLKDITDSGCPICQAEATKASIPRYVLSAQQFADRLQTGLKTVQRCSNSPWMVAAQTMYAFLVLNISVRPHG